MRMRQVLFAALLAGCAHTPHITSDHAMLGRVVIYRNGVAFYQRNATVEDGKLTVKVPRERVDDFLKSLTVTDVHSQKPLSITIPRKEADDGSYLTMDVDVGDQKRVDVQMTYVTEAPAWKPSYRVVIADDGSVMLEGWAIVDNVSGEDWKGVMVGVGASSAMSFRYDLWSVRRIDRDLLEGEQRFAVAPPQGVSPYAEQGAEEIAQLDGTSFDHVLGAAAGSSGDGLGVSFSGSSSLENQYVVDGVNTTGLTFGTVGGSSSGGGSSSSPPAPPPVGALGGVVTDTRSGQPLAGVTVTATSAGKETQTAITDERGTYRMNGVSPGKYVITYYYGEQTVEQSNQDIVANATRTANARIRGDVGGGEVIAISSNVPTVDPTSTTQGMVITKDYMRSVPVQGRTFEATTGTSSSVSDAEQQKALAKAMQDKLESSAKKIVATHKDVVVEVHSRNEAIAKAKASKVRDKLVDAGVPANKIHVSPKIGANEPENMRLLAVAPGAHTETTAPPSAAMRTGAGDNPVGESRFWADRPMTVKAGTSAMVAMVHSTTTGGVVYLYDPISDRGDDRYAFRSVRLDNPTDDTLEPGPVTVYGNGKFIGEGITEPVPPKASVVVPFALDKEIIVSHHGDEDDRIAKLETVARGVVTAELQHRRTTVFTVTSRSAVPAKVFLRHRLEANWKLTDAPEHSMKVGDSDLFEVDLGPGETKYVTIAEATPVERSMDLGSDESLRMMKVFIDEPDATPELKGQIGALLDTHRKAMDLLDKIATLREELADYRVREGELHGQLVTLKAVHTSGDLMTSLRQKLAEISDKSQKLTITLVDTQEQLMMARVRFQNQIAELHLTDASANVTRR